MRENKSLGWEDGRFSWYNSLVLNMEPQLQTRELQHFLCALASLRELLLGNYTHEIQILHL